MIWVCDRQLGDGDNMVTMTDPHPTNGIPTCLVVNGHASRSSVHMSILQYKTPHKRMNLPVTFVRMKMEHIIAVLHISQWTNLDKATLSHYKYAEHTISKNHALTITTGEEQYHFHFPLPHLRASTLPIANHQLLQRREKIESKPFYPCATLVSSRSKGRTKEKGNHTRNHGLDSVTSYASSNV
jgi:hypothetical protein